VNLAGGCDQEKAEHLRATLYRSGPGLAQLPVRYGCWCPGHTCLSIHYLPFSAARNLLDTVGVKEVGVRSRARQYCKLAMGRHVLRVSLRSIEGIIAILSCKSR